MADGTPDHIVLERRSTCPVCRAPTVQKVLDLPYDGPPLARYLEHFYDGAVDPRRLAGQRYELERCPHCGLIFQATVPPPALLASIYGRDVSEVVAASRGLRVRQRYAYEVEELVKYHAKPPGELRVLDYGAGAGMWLQMAAAYGCRTSATEYEGSQAHALRDRAVDVLKTDDLPVATFHFVNTEQVFEHLVDPLDVAHSIARALVPGGLLRVSVPNGTHIPSLLADPDWTAAKDDPRSLNAIAPLEHLNCFTRRTIVRMGELAGLTEFRYPLRQFLDPMERIRFAVSAVVHVVRKPQGTIVLLRKP
jgi:SAM-dependent methyltransferase